MFAVIDNYAEYNIHVHLADNNRRYPGHCGFDFEKIVRAFKNTGYDGAYCTEIFQLPDQDTAAESSIKHLRPIFNRIYR
jgi:sugar phosphate isomerase/epimerase